MGDEKWKRSAESTTLPLDPTADPKEQTKIAIKEKSINSLIEYIIKAKNDTRIVGGKQELTNEEKEKLRQELRATAQKDYDQGVSDERKRQRNAAGQMNEGARVITELQQKSGFAPEYIKEREKNAGLDKALGRLNNKLAIEKDALKQEQSYSKEAERLYKLTEADPKSLNPSDREERENVLALKEAVKNNLQAKKEWSTDQEYNDSLIKSETLKKLEDAKRAANSNSAYDDIGTQDIIKNQTRNLNDDTREITKTTKERMDDIRAASDNDPTKKQFSALKEELGKRFQGKELDDELTKRFEKAFEAQKSNPRKLLQDTLKEEVTYAKSQRDIKERIIPEIMKRGEDDPEKRQLVALREQLEKQGFKQNDLDNELTKRVEKAMNSKEFRGNELRAASLAEKLDTQVEIAKLENSGSRTENWLKRKEEILKGKPAETAPPPSEKAPPPNPEKTGMRTGEYTLGRDEGVAKTAEYIPGRDNTEIQRMTAFSRGTPEIVAGDKSTAAALNADSINPTLPKQKAMQFASAEAKLPMGSQAVGTSQNQGAGRNA